MSQNKLKLKSNIEQICKQKGISVRQCELNAGLPERTIFRWDTNMPSVDKVIQVAEFLEVPLEEVVGIETGKKITATQSDGNDSSVEDIAKMQEEFIQEIYRLSQEEVSALLLIAKMFLAGK